MHPVEELWRRYRKVWGKFLDASERHAIETCRDNEWDKDPVMPDLAWEEFDPEGEWGRSICGCSGDEDGDDGCLMVEEFHLYRRNKVIYQFEDGLAGSLRHCKLPDELPTTALFLPHPGIVLDLFFNGRRRYYFYRYMNPSVGDSDGELWIEINELLPDLNVEERLQRGQFFQHHIYSLDLEAFGSFGEIKRNFFEKQREQIELIELSPGTEDYDAWDSFYEEWNSEPEFKGTRISSEGMKCFEIVKSDFERNQFLLSSLLYITGNDDIVAQVHPGSKATKPKKTSRNPEKECRFRDLDEPEVFIVGREFVSVLERWENRQPTDPQGGTHASPRPHIRGAHAHLYWTGVGRTEPRVRFLPPIPVMGGIVGEPEEPHITIVK